MCGCSLDAQKVDNTALAVTCPVWCPICCVIESGQHVYKKRKEIAKAGCCLLKTGICLATCPVSCPLACCLILSDADKARHQREANNQPRNQRRHRWLVFPSDNELNHFFILIENKHH